MQNKIPYLKEMMMAFLGFSSWTVCDALIRSLKDYPVYIISFMGAFFTASLLCLLSKKFGGFRDTFYKPQLPLRLFRGLLLGMMSISAYVAFTNAPLTIVYALVFAAPFIAKILSIFLTKENVSLRSWLITLTGFIGVLVVLRPGYIPLNIGTIAALICAFLFATGFVLTKYIKAENQTLLSMCLFQYCFVMLIMAFPALQAFTAMPEDQSLTIIALLSLFGIACFSISGTSLVSTAFSRAPTAQIAPIHYTQIIWGATFSALFFQEYPDLWTLIGAAIITISGIALIKYSRPIA